MISHILYVIKLNVTLANANHIIRYIREIFSTFDYYQDTPHEMVLLISFCWRRFMYSEVINFRTCRTLTNDRSEEKKIIDSVLKKLLLTRT